MVDRLENRVENRVDADLSKVQTRSKSYRGNLRTSIEYLSVPLVKLTEKQEHLCKTES